jgi:uncharacterized protein YbjT (DUF2867 family)
MKIAVFGGTGGTGRRFVELATGHGHDLRVLTRPASVDKVPATVDPVVGDVLDPEAVSRTMSGAEAVVCILGLPRGEGTSVSDGTAAVIEAMDRDRIARLAAVTVHGLNDSRDRAGCFGKVIIPVFLKSRFEDRIRQEEVIFASGVDYTVVRPARLVDGDHTGDYQLGTAVKTSMSSKVSRADVADALLSVLEAGSFRRQAVTVVGRS